MPAPQFFDNSADFRTWLLNNADVASELVVGFYKLDSGRPSMTWSESVDEALCFGWIDGVRKRIDAHAYQIRFTPRKSNSIWSAVNIQKMETLKQAGRLMPAGELAFGRRTAQRSVVYAYEQTAVAELTDQERGEFMKNRAAWQYFATCPPSYRKLVLHWICSAKKPETRSARLATLINACAADQRLR